MLRLRRKPAAARASSSVATIERSGRIAPAGGDPLAPVAAAAAAPDAVRALTGRRPVLDLDGFVRGHLLAFADHAGGMPLADVAEAARHLAGGTLPAWLPATGAQLLAAETLPAGAGPVVVQIAGDEPIHPALLARLRRLRGEGHGVALMDGLSPRRDHLPLWTVASHVVIDLAVHGASGLQATLNRRAEVGPRIVAAGVDTCEQRDVCARLGIELVQGFHFERPRPRGAAGAAGAAVRRLRTIVHLRERPAFEQLEAAVAGDPGLTVRLLAFANSAAVSAGRTLDSVREAMMVLGAEEVRRFALGVLVSDLGAQRPALVAAALFRARLCETLVRDAGAGDPDAGYTAGLLSVADALLDQPLRDVLRSLPVGEELQAALLTHAGPLGSALATAIRLERAGGGGDGQRFARMHEVVAWVDDAVAGLAA